MTSVGYGDIVPQPNVPELLVAIISMVIGAILFAHFIGALIDIVLNISPEVCFLSYYLLLLRFYSFTCIPHLITNKKPFTYT